MEALSTAEKAAVELSPVQQAALLALLRGGTQAEAARESGAGERTVRRWLRDPVFMAALRQARCELWTRTTSRLQQAAEKAVETLLEVMESGKSEYARVLAARAVLEHAGRSLELEDLTGRALQAERDLENKLRELSETAAGEHDAGDEASEGDTEADGDEGAPYGPERLASPLRHPFHTGEARFPHACPPNPVGPGRARGVQERRAAGS